MMSISLLVSALLAVAVPDALLVAVFSAVGLGPRVYSAMASSTMSMASYGAAAFSVFWLALLFVLDFNDRHPLLQIPLGIVLVISFFAAAIMKAISYPWVVVLFCICLSVVVLGYMRANLFGLPQNVPASAFFKASSISFGTCALAVLISWFSWMMLSGHVFLGDEASKSWLASENEDVYVYLSSKLNFTTLDYESHCGVNKTLDAFSEDEQTQVKARCSDAEEVWFLQWCGPFVVVVCNTLAAGFCALFARTHPYMTEDDEMRQVQVLLKRFVMVVTLTVAFMYCSVTVSGASVSLGSAMLGLAASATAAMFGYIYLEVPHSTLTRLSSESSLGKNVAKIMKSDWVRAIAVGGLNMFIPSLAVLDMLRQKLRRCTGKEGVTEDIFTTGGRRIVDELKQWYWCGIFGKVNVLGELCILMIVGMKVTFVFFSWLNLELAAANLGFATVSVMVFFIGLGMFMCPIVPGSAVYLFAGVVLGAQSQAEGAVGFWPGVVIACVVSSVAKHVACSCQYGLGYAAGQSVKVQKFVGVDTVATRAMEQILKQKGFSLGKVCILVAGPDFPTSMLCGILKLNIPQMLLGTSPVILVSIIPQVLVGALLVMPGANSGIWKMISTAVTGGAAAFQAAATLIFSYKIMKTVERDGAALAEPRKEHEAVAELTKQQAAYTETYKEISQWDAMSCGQKATVLLASCLFLISGFIIMADFTLSYKFCFRKFSITDRIQDPYDLGGLDGSSLNIVIFPFGHLSLGLALVAFVLHVASGKWLAAVARSRLEQVSTIPADTIGKQDENVGLKDAA